MLRLTLRDLESMNINCHLIAMKIRSEDEKTRPSDRQDLLALLSDATLETLDEARHALRLIEERGFHRNRDLQKLLIERHAALNSSQDWSLRAVIFGTSVIAFS